MPHFAENAKSTLPSRWQTVRKGVLCLLNYIYILAQRAFQCNRYNVRVAPHPGRTHRASLRRKYLLPVVQLSVIDHNQ
jgi:hypothetical protein